MPIYGCTLTKCKNYVGIDTIELPGIDIKLIKDNKFPAESDSIDICLSWQVLEHVEDIPEFFSEIKRCLKKDSILYLTTHGFFRIHSRKDFWRWTEHGLIKLFESQKFSNVRVCAVDNSLSAVVSLLNNVFVEYIPEKKGFLRNIIKLLILLICSLINIVGYLISRCLNNSKKIKNNPSAYLVTANRGVLNEKM